MPSPTDRNQALPTRTTGRGSRLVFDVGRDPPAGAGADDFPLDPVGPLLQKPSPPDWVMRGLIERGSLVLVQGATSACKTFLMLNWLVAIALGIPFAGHATRQGWVVLLAGEGRRAMARRLLAFGLGHHIDLESVPIYLSRESVALNSELEAVRVHNAIKREAEKRGEPPALIVIDTLARHFDGDENAASDTMHLVNSVTRWFIEEFGCAVALVHHSGHIETGRARGSSAVPAASDYVYRVTRDGARVTLACTKAKDTEEPHGMQFDLEGIDLPWLDPETGEPVRSAYLRHVPGAPAPGVSDAPGLGKHQRDALAALRRLRDQQRQTLERGGLDPDQAQVLVDEWRAASNLPRNRWAET